MVKISGAELEIMKIMWKKVETTAMVIIDELADFSWKENTIRTLIKRLQDKGAIKVEILGNKHIYKAGVTEKEYKMNFASEVLKKLYNNSLSEFVLNYCDCGEVTLEELEEIEEIVHRYMEVHKKN